MLVLVRELWCLVDYVKLEGLSVLFFPECYRHLLIIGVWVHQIQNNPQKYSLGLKNNTHIHLRCSHCICWIKKQKGNQNVCGQNERQNHAERGKGKSSCQQSKTLECFVEEGKLNLQLSHGWQGVTIVSSYTVQCCLGADNRQNKANVEPFLLVAHRAQHDQIAQRADNKAASFGACFLLLLFFKSDLSAKQTFEGSDPLNMQKSGWISGLVLLNLNHNLHILNGKRYKNTLQPLLEASNSLVELTLDISHVFQVLLLDFLQNQLWGPIKKTQFVYKIYIFHRIFCRHSNEVAVFILACNKFLRILK